MAGEDRPVYRHIAVPEVPGLPGVVQALNGCAAVLQSLTENEQRRVVDALSILFTATDGEG